MVLSSFIADQRMQKIKRINWFFPEMLIIKESCNLTGWETQLVTPDQSWKSQMLLKILRYHLILWRNNDGQRILQSDWSRSTSGHTQPKLVVSGDTFLWWLAPSKISKRSLYSFQRYWWLNNNTIWLAESILDYKRKTRFFQGMGFCRIIKNIAKLHF